MAVKIEMPKLSDTMEEGVIAKWNVEEGDKVSSGDVIAEVETDKATMEVEVFDDGIILKILAREGDAIPLGGLMAVVGEEGEDISDILEEAEGGKEPEKAEVEEEKEEKSKEKKESAKEDKKEEKTSAASTTDNGRIKASPLARKMAEDKGIDLNRVEGSGPEGRIIKRDIEDYEPAAAPAAQIQYSSEEDEDVKISQMRKTIARRLAESKFTNPHFYETIDIDMEHAIEARNRLNEISEVKISFNDIVVKACAAALRQHPYVNSSWMDDVIRQHGDVNIAVAVAIEEGLMTPVINHADKKNLRQISTETRELAGLAKDRKLQPEQMEGSTFTVSNLGMFGIEEFTAIINPPNVCILAVGAIRDVPVVKDGEVVPGKRMKVTLSSDHRVVDGAKAADFLNTLRELLENPLSMLL
ncbi:pyruvate dehydrogenase complex dihydrolipoamide acetyltransferase [Rhodohalobacter sulfatireducens]|uniref:Acetyltransferase component of pyruvate dehydrogenase complex n=1 Tax=Rhodohalobacter sulfatireducens TaxID=2911366 RepID=A0ABS9KHA5_9BACT|nr:pyruvate dehydrogenase complex dihydrolipoamide acetyltransferase [Rhodohalobacter sulfatireducens]MCG2590205.1 pyruvate dehydrogenase complex dihydrolipoamide acetyltransferase [Rhodohalobacter sulfatireducens]